MNRPAESRYEFPIWGKPPGQENETLLHTLCKTREEAANVVAQLEGEHGCKGCRIQTLDMQDPSAGARLWGAVPC